MMQTNADIFSRDNCLIVYRDSDGERELFVVVDEDGITAFNGHVDLGTGIQTSLTQIVAEECDVSVTSVRMVLGAVGVGPDQGPTIASTTLQVTAQPLRQAAAQARKCLVEMAAKKFDVPYETLKVVDGVVCSDMDGNVFASYGQLVKGQKIRLRLDDKTQTKPPEQYNIVGRSTPRIDIPEKATGNFNFVHDVRLPGMLHGRVVRPPYAGTDHGPHVGNSLISVDEQSVADIPGLVKVVVIGDFVGIVADREENAIKAAKQLVVQWRPFNGITDLSNLQKAIRENPSTRRVLKETEGIDDALANSEKKLSNTYLWPYQMHASLGPSCGVAHFTDNHITVWSSTQSPYGLRADIARLLSLTEDAVTVLRLQGAGSFGRNCADDAAADAALLSRAVGRPVRVQLTREQEHEWEPKGSTQLIDVRGGLDSQGNVTGYDLQTHYPSNRAPTLALLLTGVMPAVPAVLRIGDRTAIPPYDFPEMRIIVHDMPPIMRAAYMRGVSALPNTFAHECFIDEAASEAGVDPVEYRIRYLSDQRAINLLKATADEAAWRTRTGPLMRRAEDGMLRGQGVAYAQYIHSDFPGFGAAWSAWVADVAVNPTSGEVILERLVVGQDTGLMVNPEGVRHQLHGNVVQSISRTLNEEVRFEDQITATREWGSYPITKFTELPVLKSVLLGQPNQPPMGAGESASVPSAAAIANAIFDATGVRFREVPFTAERIKAGLQGKTSTRSPRGRAKRLRRWLEGALGSVAAMGTFAAASLAIHSSIPPSTAMTSGIFSAETIVRGERLAALGNCVVCHTVAGGEAYAGGLTMETPFGKVVTPNITPDKETGIGTWSYTAFERAMRHGISRDGRNLYPAFPYTSYTRMTDDDLVALYAYLSTRPPVNKATPESTLTFPFNLRPLLAGWNLAFLRPGPTQELEGRSVEWNRGAYLVNAVAHCGACHTPRNAFGAERGGSAFLTGAFVKGWYAPALKVTEETPVQWSEEQLFLYLKNGFSRYHGVAAGPMADVVAQLEAIPDSDIRAIATYVASLSPQVDEATELRQVRQAELTARQGAANDYATRLYDGACGVCHRAKPFEIELGPRLSLALSSKIHSDTPDNLIKVILNGFPEPQSGIVVMPGFRDRMSAADLSTLVDYIRKTFAPNRKSWRDVESRIRSIMAEG